MFDKIRLPDFNRYCEDCKGKMEAFGDVIFIFIFAF